MMGRKERLRKKYKKIRDMIPKSRRCVYDEKIFSHFLKYVKEIPESLEIGIYQSVNSEIAVAGLVKELEELGHRISLPVISESEKMDFYRWCDGDELVRRKYDILEPKDLSITIIPDLLVVPAIACDHFGARIGYGKGFYDRYLNENSQIKTICLIYDDLITEKPIPVEIHDQKMDLIITENRTIKTC